jgi:hypothetical protein
MQTHPSLPPTEETSQEKFLRATFQHHAPVDIDVDHAWMQVAHCLPGSGQPAKQPGWLRFPFRLSGAPSRQGPMRGLSLVATIALIAVLLMGAGVVAEVASPPAWNALQDYLASLSQHVPANQFQTIGQQQQSNGVTITLEQAYAGIDRTIISLDVQLAPDMVKDYWGILPDSFDFVVNGQKETLKGKGMAECVMNFGRNHSEYCVWVLSPVQVSANAKKLDVTWDFTTVTLKLKQPGMHYHVLNGHWHFHFALPFHQQRHDPGQPPTPTH